MKAMLLLPHKNKFISEQVIVQIAFFESRQTH